MVFMWKILEFGSAKKSGVLTRGVVNFSLELDTPTKVSEKPGQTLVIFACKLELCNCHYDVVALFKLPSEGWNGMYQPAPGRTRIF
jgi:hypothetical protein